MKIAVFTSNQPRHLALVERLATHADEVFAVLECNTLFPGEVPDFFQRSDTMQRYFKEVIRAERTVFGETQWLPKNVRTLSMKMGDLSRVDLGVLGAALDADVHVVFGASYIKGALCEALLARRVVNIHMGVSPYYRGSSCNFWALHDERPEYVGATIHWLSKGLDSGGIVQHALPAAAPSDGFELGMCAVKAAHEALAMLVATGELQRLQSEGNAGVQQERARELRYTRNADFNDAVAAEYLARRMDKEAIGNALAKRNLTEFVRPYVLPLPAPASEPIIVKE